ncbi:MAG: ribosomal L7Ae/L30e/S12e/Gadd45 family protein [Candidatus Nitrosocaldaceae archaeon]
MSKTIHKILRDAIMNNQYIIGSKEVMKNMDKAKLVITSNTLDGYMRKKINDVCKEKNIIVYNLNNTSRELGRLCNKPFRVSILSITNVEEKDLEALTKE